MLKIKGITHIAVAVESIDDTLEKYRKLLGIEPDAREYVESQKVETVTIPVGAVGIELIEPKGNEGVKRFLEQRGPGLHHIAIEVEGIEDALAFLKSIGIPLIDQVPRSGAHGHKVAFVHPKATGGVLIELVEETHS